MVASRRPSGESATHGTQHGRLLQYRFKRKYHYSRPVLIELTLGRPQIWTICKILTMTFSRIKANSFANDHKRPQTFNVTDNNGHVFPRVLCERTSWHARASSPKPHIYAHYSCNLARIGAGREQPASSATYFPAFWLMVPDSGRTINEPRRRCAKNGSRSTITSRFKGGKLLDTGQEIATLRERTRPRPWHSFRRRNPAALRREIYSTNVDFASRCVLFTRGKQVFRVKKKNLSRRTN